MRLQHKRHPTLSDSLYHVVVLCFSLFVGMVVVSSLVNLIILPFRVLFWLF